MDCSTTTFGTTFVAYNCQTYKKFISTYDLTNIFDINIIDEVPTGFNCLILCPSDLEFAKNCKKIVFLDEIYDSGYLNKINEISNAQIYIPKNNENNLKLILSLNLSRMELTKFYKNILKLENSGFTGVFAVYSALVRDSKINISFNNFLAYFYILSELKIININKKDGLFYFEIDKKTKTNLYSSKIYNTLNFIRRVYAGN